MNKMDELIIVSPREVVFDNETLVFQGTETNTSKIKKIFDRIDSDFGLMRRGEAEVETEYKQLIPYGIIKRGNEIFVYERLSGAGETRLHGNLSIGVGGHMNISDDPIDFDLEDIILENLNREIEEEILISEPIISTDIIGLINDDSNDVGKVHLGILAILEIPENSKVVINEIDQLKGDFIEIEKLKEKETYDRLENWSKIAVDIL